MNTILKPRATRVARLILFPRWIRTSTSREQLTNLHRLAGEWWGEGSFTCHRMQASCNKRLTDITPPGTDTQPGCDDPDDSHS